MELLILGLILILDPSLYLREVCEKVEKKVESEKVEDLSGIPVSQATICRLLKK